MTKKIILLLLFFILLGCDTVYSPYSNSSISPNPSVSEKNQIEGIIKSVEFPPSSNRFYFPVIFKFYDGRIIRLGTQNIFSISCNHSYIITHTKNGIITSCKKQKKDQIRIISGTIICIYPMSDVVYIEFDTGNFIRLIPNKNFHIRRYQRNVIKYNQDNEIMEIVYEKK